jgi:hypothetical protein
VRQILIFCLFCSQVFGFNDYSNIGHEVIHAKVVDVLRVSGDTEEFRYILVSDKGNLEIKSKNKLSTTKIASFLKLRQGEERKIILHFRYYGEPNVGYRYGLRVCNVFAD